MNKTVKQAWLDFLDGEWTTEVPTENGSYPIADREGLNAGFISVWSHRNETFYNGISANSKNCPWKGWFWSKPMPDLPKPAAWPVELLDPEVRDELLAQHIRQHRLGG